MNFEGGCLGDSGGPVWRIVNNEPEIIAVLASVLGNKFWDKPDCAESVTIATKLTRYDIHVDNKNAKRNRSRVRNHIF